MQSTSYHHPSHQSQPHSHPPPQYPSSTSSSHHSHQSPPPSQSSQQQQQQQSSLSHASSPLYADSLSNTNYMTYPPPEQRNERNQGLNFSYSPYNPPQRGGGGGMDRDRDRSEREQRDRERDHSPAVQQMQSISYAPPPQRSPPINQHYSQSQRLPESHQSPTYGQQQQQQSQSATSPLQHITRDVLQGIGSMSPAQRQQIVQQIQQQQHSQQQQHQQQQHSSQQHQQRHEYASERENTRYSSHQPSLSQHYQQPQSIQYNMLRDELISSSPPPCVIPTSPPAPQANYARVGTLMQQQQQSQYATNGRNEQQPQQQQYYYEKPSGTPQPQAQQHQQPPQQQQVSASVGQMSVGDSNNWAIVQQLQQQISQLTKQKNESQQQLHAQQQQLQQQSSPTPPAPATNISNSAPPGLLTRPASLTYDDSPHSSQLHNLSSPSQRFSSNASSISSPYDSLKSHSRSISSNMQIGSLNPHASEFNPTGSSTPSSPSETAPNRDRRLSLIQRAATSTPVAFGASASPPSSVPSVTRSIDGASTPSIQSSSLVTTGALSPYAQQAQQQQMADDQLIALGLPSHPFDARELDAQIAREREDHAAYIYNFRTQVCQGFLDGTCPYDAYTCTQTHARLPRRRKPILQHGRFNYVPTRCFSFSTLVAKADGTIEVIEKLKVGDLLQGEDGRIVRVSSNRIDESSDDMYEVKVTGIGSFICTPDHPIVCNTRKNELIEVSASQLAEWRGSKWAIPKAHQFEHQLMARLCPVMRLSNENANAISECEQQARPVNVMPFESIIELPRKPGGYPFARLEVESIDASAKPSESDARFLLASGILAHNCRYVIEEKECPQGVFCRFSHVTEEVIYHASKFKTQLCSHPIDSEGRCGGYGHHCAKAHGAHDLRQPLFECTDETVFKATAQDFYSFVVPPAQRELERKYYMYVYKTRKCIGFPFNCSCDGLDWHRPEERRRGPIIQYAPMACPNVKPYLNADWSKPNIDCSGKYKPKIMKNGQLVPQESDEWDCEYAHTLLELMYHPQVYKTGACDHFVEEQPSTWKCVWKRRCAHSHGREDTRSKEEATEDWRLHLMSLPKSASAGINLNRLLSAGQAALENLNASQMKNRPPSSASSVGTPTGTLTSAASLSPTLSGHAHRRSITSGNLMQQQQPQTPTQHLQAQAHQSRSISANTLPSGRSGGVSISYQPPSHLNVMYSSDALPPPSPQHRAPIHIGQQQSVSSTMPHLTSSSSSPSLVPAHLPQSSPKTSTGLGLGFFSGTDTAMWAPSPKNAQSLSGTLAMNTMMSPSNRSKFSFDTAPAALGPRITDLPDPAAAWHDDTHATLPIEKQPSPVGSYRATPTAPLLLLEDRVTVATSAVSSRSRTPQPPLVPRSSPSPDAMLPTLWTSTPIINQSPPEQLHRTESAGDVRTQLMTHLQCTVGGAPHTLHTPITTTCCGVSFCQACVDSYLDQCSAAVPESESQQHEEQELKKACDEKRQETKSPASTVVGVCTCGHELTASDIDHIKHAPINKSLAAITQWIRASQITGSIASQQQQQSKNGVEPTVTEETQGEMDAAAAH